MPLYEVEQETERVILVGVSQQDGDDAEDSVAELAELVETGRCSRCGNTDPKEREYPSGDLCGDLERYLN